MPQERGKKTHTFIGICYEGELKLKSNVRSGHSPQEDGNAVLLLQSSCKCPLVFNHILLL